MNTATFLFKSSVSVAATGYLGMSISTMYALGYQCQKQGTTLDLTILPGIAKSAFVWPAMMGWGKAKLEQDKNTK